MTNRELLNILEDMQYTNPGLLDEEVKILFTKSDFETNISEVCVRTETLDENWHLLRLDKPDFVIVVNS